MELINLAREIGLAIQQDQDYTDYKICEQNVECDAELQKNIEIFNAKKSEINDEISKENSDKDVLDLLNKEIGELYEKIMTNDTMVKYNNAKQKFEETIQKINIIISGSAQGEDPYAINVDELSSCGGNCSGCSGCH